jgi:Fe-S-cluster containining protein
MEITIDVALVGKIVAREYDQACGEIAALGPLAAYERSQQRHDQRLAAAPDVATLACKTGCSWCCHFTVDVRPVEVLRILDVLDTQFSSDERERLQRQIAANSVVLAQLDDIERMQHNLQCPFLADARCSIYAARPQTCRNYHATNAAGCQQSFEEPDNLDIDPEFAPLVYQAGGAHVDAFSKAMGEAGYDITAFEMNTALAAAMAQPQLTRQRFEAKQPPFDSLQGDEVPLEFIE